VAGGFCFLLEDAQDPNNDGAHLCTRVLQSPLLFEISFLPVRFWFLRCLPLVLAWRGGIDAVGRALCMACRVSGTMGYTFVVQYSAQLCTPRSHSPRQLSRRTAVLVI